MIPLKDQFETSTVITIVPTQFILEIHKRQKYITEGEVFPENRLILAAPGPFKLSEGSRYSIDFGKIILFEIYDSRSKSVASQFLKGITGTRFTKTCLRLKWES